VQKLHELGGCQFAPTLGNMQEMHNPFIEATILFLATIWFTIVDKDFLIYGSQMSQ
jgi:hypothetical protein